MKKFTARFWRSNPQLANGGYETSRTIEARTKAAADKKADKICKDCVYGGMRLLDMVEA